MKFLLIITSLILAPICAFTWSGFLISLISDLFGLWEGEAAYGIIVPLLLGWIVFGLTYFIYQSIQILKGRINRFLKVTIAALSGSVLTGLYIFRNELDINKFVANSHDLFYMGTVALFITLVILIVLSAAWLRTNPEKRLKS